jgi:cytochrome P450
MKARTDLGKAFRRYFDQNEHLNGSALVQARYNHSCEYNISLQDIAAFEAGGCFATLTNTFPTAYWMLAYIYTHEEVLKDCRDELSTITITNTAEDGTTVRSIDMTSIKSSCPVITATLQEVLRHTSVGSSVRHVTEDTTVDGYKLKKGNTFIMPANILHTDPNT